MKHRVFAQILLTIWMVVSCSQVPTNKQIRAENQVEVSANTEAALMTEKFQVDKSFSGASEDQRTNFLLAEQYLSRRDEAAFLVVMQQLKNYPLYSYLQAQWLKKNLGKSAEIETFLNSYKNNRYADSLRQDWLYFLAKNQHWQLFNQYYQPTNDSNKIPLQCYFAQSQYDNGQTEQALNSAKELWLKNVNQTACNTLFSLFKQSPYFTEELIWQRFASSLRGKKANLTLANQLKQQLPPASQKTADLWLKVYRQPTLITHPNQWDTQNPKAGDIFAQGVEKIASYDLVGAIGIWEAQKANFSISTETSDYINQSLGMALASAGYHSYAHARLIKVTNPDENARQTLIRVALRSQDWWHINEALSKLTAEEKNHDKWKYWQARAWAELGKTNEANAAFAELAKKSNFYAFLAADRIKQPYKFVNIPVPVTIQDAKELQQRENFKIVAEWLTLGRKEEALREWWYAIKKSEPKQIMAAAKLAQHWQMLKLAAFTIAKAEYWHDLELRFPIAYSEHINTHATKQNLDASLVYGLIRQESVFDERAGSQVGARGLMQIMPATGRQIARQMQEPWRSDASLYEPETNVKYGVFYYKQLLTQFNGQAALAAAGYNAGPGRVKKWAPDKVMPMDIWIETIPFNETRHYVSMVLSNALFYQYLTNRDALKISDFMTDVQPLSGNDEQLSVNNHGSATNTTLN